jgi:hypothetical protein
MGAGLAGLYAAIVIVGGLIAFFLGDPWLMKGWTLAVPGMSPIYPAVLSVLALVHIQRSEGTLAGDKLARWGLLLSLLVGLGYWSYVGATYFVICRKADEYGQAFVNNLADRKTMSAFLMTLPPSERPAEGEATRAQVEARFNAGEMSRSGGGAFTAFSQTESVRILALGGAETKIEFSGVDNWDYIGGGYQVRLLYKVDTPQIAFVMEVTVQGKEGKGLAGRQWHVLWDKVGMRSEPTPVMSPKGKNQLPAAMQAREYLAAQWLRNMGEGKTLEVYLATRPADEREGARKAAEAVFLGCSAAADGLGAGALPGAAPAAVLGRAALNRAAQDADPDLRRVAVLPGMHDFLADKLLNAGKDVFWAPDAARDEIIELFREAFRHPDTQLAKMITPDTKVRFPWMQVVGDRFVVESDFATRIPSAAPRFMVEGRIVTDCDAAEAEAGTVTSWRVLRVDLVGAKVAPNRPAGAEGGPPMPPMPAM